MIKSVTDSITYGKSDLQCLTTDFDDLPVNVEDGSTCFVVDTFGVLVFHDGHWYDGKSIVK